MANYKVTDKRKFKKVDGVYTDGLIAGEVNGVFRCHGYIRIITKKGNEIQSDGEHGAKDYEDEFGFIITE